MKVVVLVDGEHYPPVTRWAIDELRGRGLDPIAALFVGGGEKLDPSAALDLGIPLRGSVPDRSVATALAGFYDAQAGSSLAFWVAGSFREKTILLVVYVGVLALMRGITEIILAFKLKGLQRRLA